MATPPTQLRIFRDRRDAGRLLASAVRELGLEDPVVLGLPRGGVAVAYEVARALDAPLDVLVARKIGAPGNPELAIGAVAEGDVEVLDDRSIRLLMVSHEELEHAIDRAHAELRQRAARYRQARGPLSLAGRTVVVVDDGLATGATARAAVRAVRARDPRQVVLAVPVGAPGSVERLREEADEVVCVQQPEALAAIGYWYEDFGPTSDAEVTELLRRARDRDAVGEPDRRTAGPPRRRAAEIELAADLAVPEPARGVVIFAHGSGSSRHSPRNRHVAEILNRAGFATVLLDLLTPDEELDRGNVFDIALLARRLTAATRWAAAERELAGLPVGYFGASTGAAAALWAAAQADDVRAVVSRGGRPDLAAPHLADVAAPVLLIVGGRDRTVLELNRGRSSGCAAPPSLPWSPGRRTCSRSPERSTRSRSSPRAGSSATSLGARPGNPASGRALGALGSLEHPHPLLEIVQDDPDDLEGLVEVRRSLLPGRALGGALCELVEVVSMAHGRHATSEDRTTASAPTREPCP